MGDHLDSFNLPTHQSAQSGSVDQGHYSTLSDDILSEQAGQLNTALESYYEERHDYHALTDNLRDLGYSDERITEIARTTQQESRFRDENNGQPSNLTPNQLLFISQQHDTSGRGLALNLNYRHIHTDPDGRQYIDDLRVRQVDGTPSKLYLPQPIPFDPLTGEQREEVDYLNQVESDIYTRHTARASTTADGQLSDQQREEIMYLATQYLNSDPDFREAQRLQFRNNVQQIQGLDQIETINEDLTELFVDIDDEYDYRRANDGVPRGIDATQYDYLRHQSGIYSGQPILLEEESGISYYYSERGKTPIPSALQIAQLQAQTLTYTELQIQPTPDDYDNLNRLMTRYLTGEANEGETINDIEDLSEYNPNEPTRDPYRFVMYSEFMQTFQIARTEKAFRDINNGRPSELSELQYEYLQSHTLIDEREERYRGQPIFTNTNGTFSYRMTNGTYMGIPSDEYIEGFIEQGLYSPPPADVPERNIILDDTDVPDFRDNRISVALGQERFNSLTPEQLDLLRGAINRKGSLIDMYDSFATPEEQLPRSSYRGDNPLLIPSRTDLGEQRPAVGDILTDLAYGGVNRPGEEQLVPTIFSEGSGDPPVLPGQTQPINLRTGEDLDVDTPATNVVRYEQFFNDNQALYYGFREMFRDILPVLTAGAGGYMTYLYQASKQKNTIQTIITEEEQLLDILQGRIQQRQADIEYEINQVDFYTDEVDFQTTQGYNILNTLNTLRGLLAGTEEDPDADIDLNMAVRNSASDLRLSNQRLTDLLNEIQQQRNTITRLREDISNTEVYTTQIQNDITQLQNTNYELFTQLKQFYPKILVGVSVGYTLGLMLSGYLYPTYMNINEPYIHADNVEYNKDKKPNDDSDRKNDYKIPDRPKSIPVPAREYEPTNKSRIVKPYEETFRPVKHGKRPLKYDEIQALKSTLSQSELNNLKNKFLYFDDNKLVMEKSNDKCRNVIQETQIPKRKIF